MLCGYLPFDDESKTVLYDKILSCQFKIPKHVSPLAADLLQRILVRRVSERYTIDQIRSHPWFSLHQPSAFSEGIIYTGELIPVDRQLAKLAAFKLDVNVDSIRKMVGENEHNKYTMLYGSSYLDTTCSRNELTEEIST